MRTFNRFSSSGPSRSRPALGTSICFLALVLIFSRPCSGRTLEEDLRAIHDYQVERIQRIDSLEDGGTVGNFGADILKECVFLSYSRWRIESGNPAGSTRSAGLEVLEMLDPSAAFALYTLWPVLGGKTGGRHLELRVDNLAFQKSLIFWRGHYFFRLAPHHGTIQDFQSFAAQLIERIAEVNLHPVAVLQLPQEGLDKDSIQFYLGEKSLSTNSRFPSRLLAQIGLGQDIEVAFARYGPSGYPLFLIGYPTPALAAQYFAAIQDGLQSYLSTRGIYLKRSGILLSMFIGPEEAAGSILDQVQYSATIKWIQQKKTDLSDLQRSRNEIFSFLRVVASSIVSTGAFCLLVAALGVVAGVIRYQIIRRYPASAHGDEVIRLDLEHRGP